MQILRPANRHVRTTSCPPKLGCGGLLPQQITTQPQLPTSQGMSQHALIAHHPTQVTNQFATGPESPLPAPNPNQSQSLQPTTGRKRKLSGFNLPDPSPPAKRQRHERIQKVCGEQGHNFVGFISIPNRTDADKVARKIHELPVPHHVTHRLILYGDACVRGSSAAAGLVWKAPTSQPEWDGLGIGYPSETVDPGVVELYAIACGLKFALNFINNTTFSVSREFPIDASFFRPAFMRTRSDMHKRKKELILFTDDVYVL
ncbi:hypothetical protein N7453_000176 [Penicillium expansum]|nr:hypothetical protein N7453_000176 [Penicillium expansum]